MNGVDLEWEDILPEPFVALLLGERGAGKTALGHRMLEVFEDDDRDAYIMGFPEEKRHLLPDWIDVLPPTTTRVEWPEDSIVLIHEAHQVLHARRSMDVENLELDELVTVSRHKNSDIVYDTQQSQRLDKNAVAAVDGICVRWPALMQEQFERRAVRPIIKDARETLSEYVTIHDEDDFTYVEHHEDGDGVEMLKKHVYVHADHFRGEYPHEVKLAEHWSEGISKAYGDTEEMVEAEGDEDEEEDDEDPLTAFVEDRKMRGILKRALQWERTHKNGWAASDVGAGGAQVSAMLNAGLVKTEYRSSSQKRYELVDRERVAERVEAFESGE